MAEAFWHSTREPFTSQAQRDAGEFAWESASFLLLGGAGGVVCGVRDLLAGTRTRP